MFTWFFMLLTAHHCELFTSLIFVKLVFNILLNFMRILSGGIYIIPTAPELSIPILIFQFWKLFVKHQATFSFQVSHET